MNNVLYVIALIFIAGWIVGFFVFGAGATIHIMLVIAVAAVMIRLTLGSKIIQ